MKPTATLTPDGQAYDLNATSVMLILADTAYGEGRHDTPPTGQARAAKTVADMLAAATAGGYKQADMLAAATAGGYKQADILETLLTRGEVSKRVTGMCAAVMDAAGNERIRAIFEAMRLATKGGAQ